MVLLPVGVGDGLVVGVGDGDPVGEADGDAPFCTKIVTLEPRAAVLLASGCWVKTVPLAYCGGPLPCWTLTWKPAVFRTWVAVAWE